MRQCSNHRHHKTNKRYASRGKNNFHLHKQNQITIEWCDTINHGQHEWMQHHSHVHQSKTTVYVPPSTHHPKIMLNWIWRDKGGNRLQKGPNNKRKQPNVWMTHWIQLNDTLTLWAREKQNMAICQQWNNGSIGLERITIHSCQYTHHPSKSRHQHIFPQINHKNSMGPKFRPGF